MRKDKKQLTPKSQFLIFLIDAGYMLHRAQERGTLQAAFYPEYAKYKAQQSYRQLIYRLKRDHYITYEYKEAKQIIKLTAKGQLEALLVKSIDATSKQAWDGQWSLVSFDIPEAARTTRNKLRALLKQYGFKALQASLYISPTPISQEGLEYLQKSKLIKYIRIFRAESNTNTDDLKKMFKR